MTDPVGRKAHDAAMQTSTTGVHSSRRRLLRGSAAAAPVLLTLASPPAMATGYACTTASNHTSANLSGDKASTSCSGWKPTKYKTTSTWPSGCSSKNTKFMDVFTSGTISGIGGNDTLSTVLNYDDSSTEKQVCKHVVAACLNAQSSKSHAALPLQTVKNIWSSYCGPGRSYTPTAGVAWTASGSTPPNRGSILQYLQSTMPIS